MNKKNKVNFHSLFFLCLLFISGNIHALLRPTKEIAEERARALQRYKKKELQKKIASLKPNEYFVYEADTGKGIAVPEKILLFSNVIKNLIHDVGQEDMPRAIPIFYSIEDFKNVVSVFKPFAMPELYLPKELYSLPRKTIEKLSFAQLINAINIVHELDFGVKYKTILGEEKYKTDWEDDFIARIWIMLYQFVSIAIDAVCDIRTIISHKFCGGIDIIEKKFTTFCNDYDYSALRNLNINVEKILLGVIKYRLQNITIYPMSVLYDYWNPLYTKLTLVTSITEFLDDIKDTVITEIKQRKYREQQSKLPFWQHD